MRIRHWIAPIAVTAVAAAVAIAAASAAGDRTHAAHATKLKIALSNSFIGNTWRLEMENTFKAACKMQPFKSEVSCSVYNSGNDVGKQTQQISNLISQHVDAIVIDAASPTGLNGIVKQACDRGILVISFDNIVTEKCGLTVNTDQLKFGQLGGQFLADQLHGKGNVVMVTGVAGTSVDTDRNNGVEDPSSRANPGSRSSPTLSGAGTRRRRSGRPPRSCPASRRSTACGSRAVPTASSKPSWRPAAPLRSPGARPRTASASTWLGGYNGHHVTGISIGQPPFLSVASLELAREILEHKHAKKSILLPFPIVTSDTVKVGETVFPDLPDSFFADFTDSGPNATVVLCQDPATRRQPVPEDARRKRRLTKGPVQACSGSKFRPPGHTSGSASILTTMFAVRATRRRS